MTLADVCMPVAMFVCGPPGEYVYMYSDDEHFTICHCQNARQHTCRVMIAAVSCLLHMLLHSHTRSVLNPLTKLAVRLSLQHSASLVDLGQSRFALEVT